MTLYTLGREVNILRRIDTSKHKWYKQFLTVSHVSWLGPQSSHLSHKTRTDFNATHSLHIRLRMQEMKNRRTRPSKFHQNTTCNVQKLQLENTTTIKILVFVLGDAAGQNYVLLCPTAKSHNTLPRRKNRPPLFKVLNAITIPSPVWTVIESWRASPFPPLLFSKQIILLELLFVLQREHTDSFLRCLNDSSRLCVTDTARTAQGDHPFSMPRFQSILPHAQDWWTQERREI